MTTETHTLHSLDLDGTRVTYREAGEGPAVLLLHGWPTSSYLWRDVMPAIARANRVVAVDLPGFGGSDKPTDVRYDFAFFEDVLDRFLDALGIDRVGLAVHDLGGPIGLHWAMQRPGRMSSIALLNTLVYPELDDAVVEFVTMLLDPEARTGLTSDEGLADIMRLGVANEDRMTPEVLAAVTAPFGSADDRLALAMAGVGLPIPGFVDIAKWLPSVSVPVRIVYGEQDRILPDVAETMARIAADIPHAEVTPLPDCGHFLQEDSPAEVAGYLASFFAETR
jgi:pimeloyl-ACP methyl ester carboxylesterase